MESPTSTSRIAKQDANDKVTLFSDGYANIVRRDGHNPHVPTGTSEVLTFYPTIEEIKNFSEYVRKIELCSAHRRCGICKIVPPSDWDPRPIKRRNYDDVDNFEINNPVIEKIEGKDGCFVKTSIIYRSKLSVREFRQLANSAKYRTPSDKANLEGLDLERAYFSDIFLGEPIYGADTEGSIYDEGVDILNMSKLKTILDETVADTGRVIKGVNTTYLYFGMFKTTFAWHAEDMDLYSINYLHFGAPKYWFAIPSEAARSFERLMEQKFPQDAKQCKAFLRHKSHIVSPQLLKENNIPYGTMIQFPNEFIITFPQGYHMGFNCGYNCAESTNFATNRWIDYGKDVILCKCRPDCVEIDMSHFMRKYRPKEFPYWKQYWFEARIPKVSKRFAATADASNNCSLKRKRTKRIEGEHNSALLVKPSSFCGRFFNQRKWKQEEGAYLSSSQVDLYSEKQFNAREALQWPHCSICSLFCPPHRRQKLINIPESSSRLTRSVMFSKISDDVEHSNPNEDDFLLTCSNCCVTVHPSCYGGEAFHYKSWKCFRCLENSDVVIRSISCKLCELRGGALLPAKAGPQSCYVHVVCGIFSRRVIFNPSVGPKSCTVRALSKECDSSHDFTENLNEMSNRHENSKFQCDICQESAEGLVRCSICPEDALNPTYSHVTCGKAAGFLFEERQFPLCVSMICSQHDWDEDDDDPNLEQLHPPCEVIAWMNDGARIKEGNLLNVSVREFYVIEFLDGSISSNTLREDIVQCDCVACDGSSHQFASKVFVRWDDGKVYEGFFRRKSRIMEHLVRLRTGEEVTLKRSELYGPDEPIPVRIRRKLSCKSPSTSPKS